jgi:predicted NBD/HSP70 family sugar kinase
MPASPFIAGVDIGASNVRVVIANEDGEIEARRHMPFDAGAPPEHLLRAIERTIDDLARGVWVGATVGAIGVALPGSVDPGRGLVATPANMPGWGAVDVAGALGRGGALPVAVENDANAAAVGEGWLGAARGMADHVFVALGTGIGTGLWLGGRLHRGAHFLAGEAAFFPMSRDQLRAASWQHNLEALVGGRAIAARAAEILGPRATPGGLFEAASAGDAKAAAAVAEVCEYLAMALVDIISLLDPGAVVLGGGVAMAQGERLLGPVRALVHAATPVRTEIRLSELGEDAQILGAVRLAVDLRRGRRGAAAE